jgi:hypothetical protein
VTTGVVGFTSRGATVAARVVRLLALIGALLGALLGVLGVVFFDWSLYYLCFDACPAETDLPAAFAARFADIGLMAIISLPLLVGTWTLCIVVLLRARRWPWAVAAACALPMSVALAAAILLPATGDHPPETWPQLDAWRDREMLRALLPLTTLAARHDRGELRTTCTAGGDGRRSKATALKAQR